MVLAFYQQRQLGIELKLHTFANLASNEMNGSPLKILFLTKYTRTGASSRYRTFQYLSHIKRAGVNCEVSPLFGDNYLFSRYKKGHGSALDMFSAFLRRLLSILKAYHADLIVIEYELFPYFPAIFERILKWSGCHYVVDYDDALFHQYDQHRNAIVRTLMRNKIATVMQYADLVVAGNTYLADYAHRAEAKRVEIMPTVVDLDLYPLPAVEAPEQSPFVIGWIGSLSTAQYLQEISQALAEACEDGGVLVRVIGAGVIELQDVPVSIVPWDGATEVATMQTFDVGIMPLPENSWTRGKCGFKLIQYMACGLPVVASPVGANCEIVEHGMNGFLAQTDKEWVQAIFTLRDNPELRKKMGQAGRRKVEEHYSLQVTSPRYVDLMKSVFKKG